MKDFIFKSDVYEVEFFSYEYGDRCVHCDKIQGEFNVEFNAGCVQDYFKIPNVDGQKFVIVMSTKLVNGSKPVEIDPNLWDLGMREALDNLSNTQKEIVLESYRKGTLCWWVELIY